MQWGKGQSLPGVLYWYTTVPLLYEAYTYKAPIFLKLSSLGGKERGTERGGHYVPAPVTQLSPALSTVFSTALSTTYFQWSSVGTS